MKVGREERDDRNETAGVTCIGSTLGEARALFCARNGLPCDGGEKTRWWSTRFGKIPVRLPNFVWRRHALLRHDLHHVVTGYPCTPVGEMQMAAWEFSAGRFPSWCATAFCLPLVGLGAIYAPRATFAAFLRGRYSVTFYREASMDDLLATDVDRLRARVAPTDIPRPFPRDVVAYAWIVCQSLTLLGAPWLLGVLLVAISRTTH